MQYLDEDHGHSLAEDLVVMERMIARRRALKWFAGMGTAAIVAGCGSDGSSGARNFAQITLASDNVFGDNTSAQITQQTPTLTGSVAAGYTGTALIGIAR